MKKRVWVSLCLVLFFIASYLCLTRFSAGLSSKNPLYFDVEKLETKTAVFKDESQIENFRVISGHELGRLQGEVLSDYCFHGNHLYVMFSMSKKSEDDSPRRRLVEYDLWTKKTKLIFSNIPSPKGEVFVNGLSYTQGKLYWVDTPQRTSGPSRTLQSFDLNFLQSTSSSKIDFRKLSDLSLFSEKDIQYTLNQSILTKIIEHSDTYNFTVTHSNHWLISNISLSFSSPFLGIAASDGSTVAFGTVRTQGLVLINIFPKTAKRIDFNNCLVDRRGVIPLYLCGNKIVTNGPDNNNLIIYDKHTNTAAPMLSSKVQDKPTLEKVKSINGKLTVVKDGMDLLIEKSEENIRWKFSSECFGELLQ